MADNDYAIVPEKEVNELKSQIDSIRKNPLGPYGGADLISAITNLTKAINSLMQLFETAAEELKLEEREAATIAARIDPLLKRVETISEQNRRIAQGIVAVADLLEEAKIERKAPAPKMAPLTPPPITPSPIPPPPMPPGSKPPAPMMAKPSTEMNLGPAPKPAAPFSGMKLPPIPPPKKKGLFSFK
ncbi:MbeD family mobilization/exclusion protein [Candidatus Woesearchaeota archaeon]|nr:MbeD family mobilization/exclusion protein [Candidatus Woesearchaeota archaeon]